VGDVDQVFVDRWRSGFHIGNARPQMTARVRRGRFFHDYRTFTFLDGSDDDFMGQIPDNHQAKPWWPQWTPQTDWKPLPNVTACNKNQGFDNNGFQSVTVELENVVFKALTGVLGTYHAISRGELAPWRGFTQFGRRVIDAWMSDENEWYQFLIGAQIEVWQGYGDDHHSKGFTGLIDSVDMTSHPDHMTITALCFGSHTLGQQRLFNNVKAPKLVGPITFADRLKNTDTKKVGGGASASSVSHNKRARNVSDTDSKTEWWSDVKDSADHTEWVEIRVPRGRYDAMAVFPAFPGMELFISVYCTDRQKGTPQRSEHDPRFKPKKRAQVSDVNVDQGWYDPVSGNAWESLDAATRDARRASGDHIVPGVKGGIPWVQHIKHNDKVLRYHRMNGTIFEVGDNSIVRVSWRRLHYSPADRGWVAGVKRLFAVKRTPTKLAQKNNWILVDDPIEIVKVVLRWGGFREWELESFGMKLKDPLVFHQSDFLIDIINKLKEWGDFQFFMGDPTSDDLSTGVPKFRHTRALTPDPTNFDPRGIPWEVRDKDLLTGITVKLSKTNKATRIYARGKDLPKKKGGWALQEDKEFRVTAVYVPPWRTRMEGANVIRQVVHFDKMLQTKLDCAVMCRLIAAQEALQSATGGIEIPGNPALELDDQVSVIDEGTGANTRLWIAQRQDSFTVSPEGQVSWKTSLNGSWIDTLDIQGIAIDLVALMQQQIEDSDSGTVRASGPGPGLTRPAVTAHGPGILVR
jgi:hypothetical protein